MEAMMPIGLKARLPGLVLLVIALVMLAHTFDPQYSHTMAGLNVGPVFFPQLLLYGWIALALLSLVVIPDALRQAVMERRRHWPAAALSLLLAAYLLLLDPLGFLISSIMLCTAVQWIVGRRIAPLSVVWGALLAVLSWAAFEFLFGIPLPEATLF
ncbi:tripartite tricarboxylate transporter TctB family protein [Defluviimonas sp. SAOS-178_SWC]|uniref:tripartite tricarboxylate transporter TctB family protein n=1 Tax=Defluviimonas sp. SAOS-178_SWC TaxID=3121287 RepID=UPI0032221D06